MNGNRQSHIDPNQHKAAINEKLVNYVIDVHIKMQSDEPFSCHRNYGLSCKISEKDDKNLFSHKMMKYTSIVKIRKYLKYLAGKIIIKQFKIVQDTNQEKKNL